MSKEQTAVGIVIKEVISAVLRTVVGKPVEQSDSATKPQTRPLSENSLEEIENITNES